MQDHAYDESHALYDSPKAEVSITAVSFHVALARGSRHISGSSLYEQPQGFGTVATACAPSKA
jgi:hypothetical protein